MGKFIDTQHKDMVDALTYGVVKDTLKNPYYLFEDAKATPVIFYEIDKDQSTLDDSTRLEYDPNNSDCPLRYKKINGVYLYGLSGIEIRYENSDEEGLIADPISGECTDLPNTIHPTPGCYFEIPYLNKDDSKFLFTITDVTEDTLDNGNNMHKMQYELGYTDLDTWEKMQGWVVEGEEYEFIPGNVGTERNSVIRSSTYYLVEKLDTILTVYRQYYNQLFYNDRVQTYTFKLAECYDINDSYVIEFLIRNKLMNGGGADYTYVSHMNPVPKSFGIDYAKSVFRAIETNDFDALSTSAYYGHYYRISNMTTIFMTRQETYYYVDYSRDIPINTVNYIEAFDPEFIRRIVECELYPCCDDNAYKNIIIKYANGMIPISTADAEALDKVEYDNAKDLYYTMPLVMYCMERYVKDLMAQHTDN